MVELIQTYHALLKINATCSSYLTCNLLSGMSFCHPCNLINILLLHQNLFQLVLMQFWTISWLFFTFFFFFFNHAFLPFNIVATWTLTCLNAYLSTLLPLELSHAWMQRDDLNSQTPCLVLLWLLLTLQLVASECHQWWDLI